MSSRTPKPALKATTKTATKTTKSTKATKTTKTTTTTEKQVKELTTRLAAVETKVENFINLVEREFSSELLMGPRGLGKRIRKFFGTKSE